MKLCAYLAISMLLVALPTRALAEADESRPLLSAKETKGLYLIRTEIRPEAKTERKRLAVRHFVPQVRVPDLPDEEDPPVIHIDELATEVDAPHLTVSGRVEDTSGVALVEVNGKTISFDAEGNFVGEIELDPGSNEIRIQATDLSLNEAEEILTIRLLAGT